MTPTELAELRAMSEWILGPSFYVEARVGSENHRGECCRALMNGGGRNEPADELLKRFARAFLAAPPPLAWTDAKPTVPGWYWFKGPLQKTVKVVEIRTLCDEDDELVIGHPIRYMPLATCFGQFAGPIPLPVGLEVKEME